MLEKDYKEIINEIKKEISIAQYQAAVSVNEHLINMYFNLGKIISENASYGSKFIENASTDLRLTFQKSEGFSARNLSYMKKLYEEYKDLPIPLELVKKIPWKTNVAIMTKVKNIDERIWYLNKCIENGWSRSVAELQIKSGLYQRQEKTKKLSNYKTTLPSPQSDLAIQTLKDPYKLDFIALRENFKERELENKMIEQIKNTLLELGTGFTFVGNQYKLTVDDEDYYIDLLFYNLKLRCFVVVELKTKKFKPEYAGKLNFYLSAVDELVKSDIDNPTIGILLVQEKSKFSVELALKDINKPIGVSSYEVSKIIPKEVLETLPTEEDINMHVDIDDDMEVN